MLLLCDLLTLLYSIHQYSLLVTWCITPVGFIWSGGALPEVPLRFTSVYRISLLRSSWWIRRPSIRANRSSPLRMYGSGHGGDNGMVALVSQIHINALVTCHFTKATRCRFHSVTVYTHVCSRACCWLRHHVNESVYDPEGILPAQ